MQAMRCGPLVRLMTVSSDSSRRVTFNDDTKSKIIAETAGTSSSGSAGSGSTATSPAPGGGVTVGQLTQAPSSKLPTLPQLTNVVALEREDSVGIDFDPVDDAIDYRVYPLPDAGDLTVNANGSIKISNGVYRCAGLRQAFDIPNDQNSTTTNGMTAANAGLDLAIGGGAYPPVSAQIPKTPTLVYVYVTPGTGLVPVYAVAVYPESTEEGWRGESTQNLHDGLEHPAKC